jgi:hypothetical protein
MLLFTISIELFGNYREKGKTMRALFGAVLLSGIAASVLGQPIRTFVSVTGNDANPCSRTLPCRNFSAAVNAVAAAGEVVALSTGGYGPVSITKSVALIGEPGVHAAIAPTSGDAISIAAASTDVVWIRNLYLNAQGAVNGVVFTSGASLHVQNLVANGFSSYGLHFNAAGEVYVSDSLFRNNNNTGIHIEAPTGMAKGTIDRVHLNANGNISGIGSDGGLTAGANSRVTVNSTVASTNFRGFQVIGANAQLDLERSAALNGVVGLFTSDGDATTIMRVSNSTIVNNTLFGIEAQGSTQILSRVNNTVVGNAAAETFSSTFAAK